MRENRVQRPGMYILAVTGALEEFQEGGKEKYDNGMRESSTRCGVWGPAFFAPVVEQRVAIRPWHGRRCG